MKKIINGKVYDTDTAKYIGSDNDQPTGNWGETLYRKKTGEFFIDHWDVWSERRIEPMTFKAAQKWTEEHLSAETYIELFGEPDESGEAVTLGIQVSAEAAAKLKREAARNGISQREQLEKWIMNG